MSALTEGQPNARSTKSLPAENAGNVLRDKIGRFLKHVENAELDICLNGWRGPIPPDCLGDNWDSLFELDFKQLEPHLTSVKQITFYRMPLARHLSSLWATSAIEAWMLFLNPIDHCYGELGILRSPEYLQIKRLALAEIELLLGSSDETLSGVTRGRKVRGQTAARKPSRELPKPSNTKQPTGNPAMGVIDPGSLYVLAQKAVEIAIYSG